MRKGFERMCCGHWAVVAILMLLPHFTGAIGKQGDFEAEDCAWYEDDSYRKTMSQMLSTGVKQKASQFAATLQLTSQDLEKSCQINMLGEDVVITCGGSTTHFFKWSSEIFKEEDITDLWVHVGSLGVKGTNIGEEQEDGRKVSTDLAIIGRRGAYRGHVLFPSSGLQPPLTVRWKPMQEMAYYYNCVTGCPFTKYAATAQGAHTIFFRPGDDFSFLEIAYNSTSFFGEHRVVLNSSDITLDNHWRNLTVVWNKQDGGIGVLINGQPINGLESYSTLSKKNGITAEIEGNGAYIRLCDPRFKEIADVPDAGQGPSFRTRGIGKFSDETAEKQTAPDDVSKNWLVILALSCIGLLFLAAIVLLILLLRTKRQLQLEKDAAARNIVIDTLTSTRTATVKSTAPLYPDANGGQEAIKSSQEAPKQMPPVPGGKTHLYTYVGSKT